MEETTIFSTHPDAENNFVGKWIDLEVGLGRWARSKGYVTVLTMFTQWGEDLEEVPLTADQCRGLRDALNTLLEGEQ